MLIRTIEQYQLYLYDKQGYVAKNSEDAGSDFARYVWISAFPGSGYAGDGRKIYENNSLKCIVARSTDNLSKLSDMLGITEKKLVKYNDLKYAGSLEPGQVVYMQPKKRKAAVHSHVVKAGETLYEISQRYGIKMKLLLKRSGMSEGMEPFPGQLLLLK